MTDRLLPTAPMRLARECCVSSYRGRRFTPAHVLGYLSRCCFV
jgi:hypothetical protein